MSASDNKEQCCRIITRLTNDIDDSKVVYNLETIFVDAICTESSLLESAILNDDAKLLKMLLDRGINVNPMFGNHPLHIAIENNKCELVDVLLSRGADVNVRNCDEMTPLHVATVKGLSAIAETLLDNGANVDSTIHHSDNRCYRKFRCVASQLNKRITKTFVKDTIEVKDTPTAINDASEALIYGNPIAEQFHRGTSILYAIQNGDVQMTKLLLKKGANIQNDPGLLGAAVNSGNLDIIECLTMRNIDININGKDEYGDTALHRAALVCNSDDVKSDIAKLLLNRGAYVRSRNRSGQTPLHLAAQKGHAKLVATLLDFNPHESVSKNLGELTRLGLYDKAALLCAKNAIGETALHMASSRNHQTVVEILLKHGIDIDSKTIFGKTALDVAFEKGCRQAFTVLLKHGSDINVAYAANIPKRNRSSFCIIKCNRGEFITSNKFCSESIRKHIVKVKTSGRFVSEGNLRCLDGWDESLSDYRDECEKEVLAMRNEKICRNVSFFDVMGKSVNQLGVYVRDKRIVRILESKEFRKKFPIYSDMIRYNFKRGQVRELLLNISLHCFNIVTEYYLPPEVVITNVFRYLENEDLGNLMEAWNSSRI